MLFPHRTLRRALRPLAVALTATAALGALAQAPLTSAAFTASTANSGSTFASGTWCSTPGQVTLTVLNDAEVQEKDPSRNYGNKAPIEVRSKAGDNRRIFVRPPLPAIPADCQLTSAVLTLTIIGAKDSDGRTYEAQRATSQWNVGTITWGNQPAVAGATASGTVTATPTWSMDITAPVLELYGTGTNYGIRIRDSVEDETKDINTRFDSLDGSAPGQVTYTWG